MAMAWRSHGDHMAVTRQSHGNHTAITGSWPAFSRSLVYPATSRENANNLSCIGWRSVFYIRPSINYCLERCVKERRCPCDTYVACDLRGSPLLCRRCSAAAALPPLLTAAATRCRHRDGMSEAFESRAQGLTPRYFTPVRQLRDWVCVVVVVWVHVD
jgi:hypothetical protein